MGRRTLLIGIACFGMVVASCGGDSKKEAAPGSDDTVPTTAAADGTTKGSTPLAPGPAPSGDGSAIGSSKPPTTAVDGTTPGTGPSGKPKLPMKSSIGSSCIRAGEKQTITIQTVPDSGVGYDSYYPDGKSGLSE